jgi:D-xylose transport system substrate-binding protein
VTLTGIEAESGEPTDETEGEGIVPYVALQPIGVTVDNVADTVIADEFRTIEELCTGEVANTEFCQQQSQ